MMSSTSQRGTLSSLGGLSKTEEALKASLSSPDFLDVKFFAFSRKYVTADGTVRVDRPQPILAISSVLKKIEDLDRLLSSGFAESNTNVDLHAGFPSSEARYSDEYDYDSDSDLDYEENPDDLDLDEGNAGAPHSKETPAPQSAPGSCRQIIIKDAAFYTWRAFIFYLYTGKVKFMPLKSKGEEARTAELLRSLGDANSVPPCSPKSMYRLADKYGVAELRSLAFHAIRERVSTANIVKEVFSKFTSWYDQLQEIEIDYLCTHYTDSDVTNSLKQMADGIVQGEYPHAGEVLKTLFELNLDAGSHRHARYLPGGSITGRTSSARGQMIGFPPVGRGGASRGSRRTSATLISQTNAMRQLWASPFVAPGAPEDEVLGENSDDW